MKLQVSIPGCSNKEQDCFHSMQVIHHGLDIAFLDLSFSHFSKTVMTSAVVKASSRKAFACLTDSATVCWLPLEQASSTPSVAFRQTSLSFGLSSAIS